MVPYWYVISAFSVPGTKKKYRVKFTRPNDEEEYTSCLCSLPVTSVRYRARRRSTESSSLVLMTRRNTILSLLTTCECQVRYHSTSCLLDMIVIVLLKLHHACTKFLIHGSRTLATDFCYNYNAWLLHVNYHTGALLGACAYTSTGKKYALIREMRLIKSAFFNAGISRTAAKYALNSEYAPISDMRLITYQYGTIVQVDSLCAARLIRS